MMDTFKELNALLDHVFATRMTAQPDTVMIADPPDFNEVLGDREYHVAVTSLSLPDGKEATDNVQMAFFAAKSEKRGHNTVSIAYDIMDWLERVLEPEEEVVIGLPGKDPLKVHRVTAEERKKLLNVLDADEATQQRTWGWLSARFAAIFRGIGSHEALVKRALDRPFPVEFVMREVEDSEGNEKTVYNVTRWLGASARPVEADSVSSDEL